MKALEKDRRRRYETANDFAADVMRYLTDQPVEACPPSAWYRLAKYIRRHRASLATAATILFFLIASTAASTWQAIRATAAERRATHNLDLGLRAVNGLYEDVVGRSFKNLRWQPDAATIVSANDPAVFPDVRGRTSGRSGCCAGHAACGGDSDPASVLSRSRGRRQAC